MAQPYMYPGSPGPLDVYAQIAAAMARAPGNAWNNAKGAVGDAVSRVGQVLQNDLTGVEWAAPAVDAVTQASNAARGRVGQVVQGGLESLGSALSTPEADSFRAAGNDWLGGMAAQELRAPFASRPAGDPRAGGTAELPQDAMLSALQSMGVPIQQATQYLNDMFHVPEASQSFPLANPPPEPDLLQNFGKNMDAMNSFMGFERLPEGAGFLDSALGGNNPNILASHLRDWTHSIGNYLGFGTGGAEAASPVDPNGLSPATNSLDQQLLAAMQGRMGPMAGGGGGAMTIGGSAPLPMEMFEQAVPGAVAPPNYMALSKYLPQPQRVQRQIAPAPDYSATDAAYAEAAPEAPEHAQDWEGILSGLGQAALGYGGAPGNTGALLLALGGGALSGFSRGRETNRALDRRFEDQENEYQLNRAGYEAGKAETNRAVAQQGFDAGYEADTDYRRQQDAHGAQLAALGAKGLDADYDFRKTAAVAGAAQKNAHLAAQRQWLDQFKPEFKVLPGGGIMIIDQNPETGEKRVRVDNSSVIDAIRAKAMYGAMGGGDETEIDKLYGPGPGALSGYQPIWNLALQMAQAPQLAQQILGDEAQGIFDQAMQTSNGDGELMARYIGNGIYAHLMNMRVQEPEVVEQALKQLGLLPSEAPQ